MNQTQADAIPPLVSADSGDAVPLTDQARLNTPLGGPNTHVERLTAWLEAPDGRRYPLDIAAIGHAATPNDAEDFFSDVAVVLVAHGDGNYGLIVAIHPLAFGPGGPVPGVCRTLLDDSLASAIARWWNSCP